MDRLTHPPTDGTGAPEAAADAARRLPGPILVLGASGFVGANLLRRLLRVRPDVVGTASRYPAWRLAGLPEANVVAVDLLVPANLRALLDRVAPRTVFDLVAYGAYGFQTDVDTIHRTNHLYVTALLEELRSRRLHAYVHAGSSSEYGTDNDRPDEDSRLSPNSHYAAAKIGAAKAIELAGRHHGVPAVSLRLYSVYGPYEDAARLVPAVLAAGAAGRYPPLVDPEIARDFVYVEDACDAFVLAADRLQPAHWGSSVNIGSGVETKIREVAAAAQALYGLSGAPSFTMAPRPWDVTRWVADARRAEAWFGWRCHTPFAAGLAASRAWFEALGDRAGYLASSKQHGADTRHSVSAVIACYKDAQAIGLMHERLTRVFADLGVDYEIIFVNDCSPDDSLEVIRRLSAGDRHVLGINHSRNFGSQAAFRSGMEVASKNSCVLLDGDLQDPPELIAAFVERWKAGYEVVYGRRVRRVASLPMRWAFKAFYRLFAWFSYLDIPRDAGDFALMDRRVVRTMLRFPERDLFLRGVRAFVGFAQCGVDYERPERRFGRSTNNLWRHLGWAKKGILSFSNTPLNMLTAFAVALVLMVWLAALVMLAVKIASPELAPRGATTILLVIAFFGSLNLLGLSLLGEYIAKIFEEVKQRPHFVRRTFVRDGRVLDAIQEGHPDAGGPA